jgi:hypothetical protein
MSTKTIGLLVADPLCKHGHSNRQNASLRTFLRHRIEDHRKEPVWSVGSYEYFQYRGIGGVVRSWEASLFSLQVGCGFDVDELTGCEKGSGKYVGYEDNFLKFCTRDRNARWIRKSAAFGNDWKYFQLAVSSCEK